VSQVDILFLSWNRLDFTMAALNALEENTDWGLVGSVCFYDDCSIDGTADLMRLQSDPDSDIWYMQPAEHVGSPVGIMNRYLTPSFNGQSSQPYPMCVLPLAQSPIFVKLDNDVIVPPGWLSESLAVMEAHPEVDLLGIEPGVGPDPVATRAAAVPANGAHRGIVRADFIGGIGLMRRSAFEGRELPTAAGRFGFGHWQEKHADLVKAWIAPGLPLFLLNRLPFEPWASLSREYVANGWQRPWPDPYTEADAHMWQWWTP
jgi:hypothetical protein